MPFVENIIIYPIKSMDGLSVAQAAVASGGSLAWDRQFAFFDAEGKVVNAKKYPDIHRIRADYNLNYGLVTFSAEGQSKTFDLFYDIDAIACWVGDFLGTAVTMRQNNCTGFPDDNERTGPTVISTATLQTVADWFGMSLEQTRRRFRANIEIGGCPAFWEDSLIGELGTAVSFQIGEVVLQGLKACARCSVPSRNPDTGVADRRFQLLFERQRRNQIPAFAPKSQFPHYYHLSINTNIAESQASKLIKLGDWVQIA
jgi:hypothetical protein